MTKFFIMSSQETSKKKNDSLKLNLALFPFVSKIRTNL